MGESGLWSWVGNPLRQGSSRKAFDPILQFPVAFQRLPGRFGLSGILVESGQKAVGHRIFGQEPDRLAGSRNGLVELPEPPVDLGQTEVEIGKRHSLALLGYGSQLGQSQLGFSELKQQVSQLQAGLAVVRVILHLPLQGLEGLLKLPGGQVNGGQVVVSPGVAGFPGGDRLELPQSLAPHVLLEVCPPEVHPGLEMVGFQFQGLFQQPDALFHYSCP